MARSSKNNPRGGSVDNNEDAGEGTVPHKLGKDGQRQQQAQGSSVGGGGGSSPSTDSTPLKESRSKRSREKASEKSASWGDMKENRGLRLKLLSLYILFILRKCRCLLEDEESPVAHWTPWTGGQKVTKKREFSSHSETGREVFLGLTESDKNMDNYNTAFKRPPDVSRKIRFLPQIRRISSLSNKTWIQSFLHFSIGRRLTTTTPSAERETCSGRGCRNGLCNRHACRDVSLLLEQDLLADLMPSIKISSVGFMEVTNERRTLALSQFKDVDIKRIISEVSPNQKYLFGGQIQQVAQQLRDANLLSRSFVDPSDQF